MGLPERTGPLQFGRAWRTGGRIYGRERAPTPEEFVDALQFALGDSLFGAAPQVADKTAPVLRRMSKKGPLPAGAGLAGGVPPSSFVRGSGALPSA
eukprot:6236550-Pyramimonas_sp.AAC.1